MKKEKAIAVIEIGDNKDSVYMNGYIGGSYHILVTAFKPDSGYVKSLTHEHKVIYRKQKDASQRASGSTVPSDLNDTPFYIDSIPNPDEKVKTDSTKKSDRISDANADYMTAVKNGDMETAQRLVNEAAARAGYTMPLYHGAKNGGGFTKFRDWSYFTPNKDYATRYTQRGNESASLYSVFVKAEHAFDTRKAKDKKIFETIKQEYGLSNIQDTGLPDWTDGYDIADFIDESDLDYDAILLDEGGDLVDGKPVSRGISYVVRKSAQIKSAEAVTYDDNGNVIPLSQRFDESNSDIRYSDRASDSMSNRALLANALESTIDTSTENGARQLILLNKYKKEIANLDARNAELREVKKELSEMYFSSGKRNKKRLAELNARANSLTDYIAKHDKTLLSLEANKHIKSLLEIEKQKATQKQREKDADILKRRNEGKTKTQKRHKIRKLMKDISKLLTHETKEKNVKADIKDTAKSALDLINIIFSDSVSNEDIVRRGVKVATPAEKALVNDYSATLNVRENSLITIEAVQKAEGLKSPKLVDLHRKLDEAAKKIRKLDDKLKELFEREKAGIREAIVSDAFDVLIKEYEKLKDSEDSYIKNTFDEAILQRLKDINQEIGGTRITNMTHEQLDSVLNILECVSYTIRTANTTFINGKREHLSKTVNAVQSEILRYHKNRGDLPDKFAWIQDIGRWVAWQELKPIYAFDKLGSETFRQLYWEVLKGEGVYARYVQKAKEFISEQREKYGYADWDMETAKTFTSSNGLDFKLTVGDMMSIYAYSRRPQAEEHMSNGGFQFDVGRTYRSDEDGQKYRTPEMSETFKVDRQLIDDILASLTKEQKEYATNVQSYLTDLGKDGNKVSRQLYGIDIFGEESYFPLKSATDYRSSIEQTLNHTMTQSSLKSSGFTKPTQPHADNPIVLRKFDDVAIDHIDEMSKYIALVLPIENLRKVYDNVSTDIENGYSSTKAIIKGTFGASAEKYFDKYITDLNGGIKTGEMQNKAMKFFSRSKKVAVGASLSVWIQQYFSVVRAMSMIDSKYFTPWNNREATQTEMASQWEELKQYAPIAIIKEMGGFDIGSSRSMRDYVGITKHGIGDTKAERAKGIAKGLIKDPEYRRNTLDNVFGIGAELMDKVGWSTIWRAVKKEIAETTDYTPGTDEFLNACGERFTEVIAYTQVYDSVNSRSHIMRSNSDLNKFMTSFMGEPTAQVNMAYGALLKCVRDNTKSNRMALGRTLLSLAVGTVMTTLAKSLIYANRDDEDELTWTEKWMEHFGDSLKSDINPLNMFPWTKDLMSTIEGWNVDRPDMTLIADVISSSEKLFKDDATWDEFCDWVGAVGNAFGVPAKNIIKDVRGIRNLINEHFDDDTESYEGHALIEGFGKDGFKEALFGGDYTIMEKIEDAFEHGDTATLKNEISRLLDGKKEEIKAKHPKYTSSEVTKKAKSAIKSKFTATYKTDYVNAYKRGDTAETNRIRKLLYATGLYGSLSELDKALREWCTEE